MHFKSTTGVANGQKIPSQASSYFCNVLSLCSHNTLLREKNFHTSRTPFSKPALWKLAPRPLPLFFFLKRLCRKILVEKTLGTWHTGDRRMHSPRGWSHTRWLLPVNRLSDALFSQQLSIVVVFLEWQLRCCSIAVCLFHALRGDEILQAACSQPR